MENITFKEWELVAHSLGIQLLNAKQSTRKKDKELPIEFYRNYYCAGENKISDFKNLEDSGLVNTWEKVWDERCTLVYYGVTEKGIQEFRDWFKINITDIYDPLSKAKETYQEYIYTDCCDSFADFLGIWVPEYEYSDFTKLHRIVSTNPRYRGLNGDWCNTKALAKDSYKEHLKAAKKEEKEVGYYSKSY